eukprot:1146145-Pelagomonas_calceolata.AAC.1
MRASRGSAANPNGAVVGLQFFLAIFPAKIEVWGAIVWTPAPAPRSPKTMLLIKCPAITAGQASRGQLPEEPMLAGISPDSWPHTLGSPRQKL